MTTRKINIAVTVLVEAAFDPSELNDYQATNEVESALFNALNDFKGLDGSKTTMSYKGMRDVVHTESIKRGNGSSIAFVRPMAFDELLDNYNHNRAVANDEWESNYKEYSHLMRTNNWQLRELPWVGREDMTKVWSRIVQTEREERESRINMIVRKQILSHLDGAFEDGVQVSDTDGQGAGPF